MATPKGSSGTTTTAYGDIAAITVGEKIPTFWKDQPRLWFTQFESIVAPQKQGDDYKYHLVVAKLTKDEIQQISDLLSSPPEINKYDAIKDRLINTYEESEQRRFHKLLSGMDLGDEKPSQLLRRMKDLGRGKLNDDTIRLMWLRHLPVSVTSVLAITDELSVDKLSQLADKIYEGTNAASTNRPTSEVSVITSLTAQLAQMQFEIAALRAEQAKYNSMNNRRNTAHNYRGRSRSRGRSFSKSRFEKPRQDGVCYYHGRFGDRSYKCRDPCSWKAASQSTSNLGN